MLATTYLGPGKTKTRQKRSLFSWSWYYSGERQVMNTISMNVIISDNNSAMKKIALFLFYDVVEIVHMRAT